MDSGVKGIVAKVTGTQVHEVVEEHWVKVTLYHLTHLCLSYHGNY